jgi:hypothetical protein
MDDLREQLALLISGELSGEEAAAVRARLEADPGGRAELAAYESMGAFLREESGVTPSESLVRAAKVLLRGRAGVVERVGEKVRAFIASLDFDSRISPALAGTRGVAGVVQLAFSAEPCELDLELMAEDDGSCAVIGQVTADDTAGWTLVIDGAEPVERRVEDDGAFRVVVPAGVHTLVLIRGDVRVEFGPVTAP